VIIRYFKEMHQDPILNIISGALNKTTSIVKRDFHELQFIKKNKAQFSKNTFDNVFNSICNNLEKANFNSGIMRMENDDLRIIKPSKNNLNWLIQPMDAIQNFENNLPFFGTTIVLTNCENNTEIIAIGFINAISGECFSASHSGAFINGQKLRLCPNATIFIAGGEVCCNRNFGSDMTHLTFLLSNKVHAAIFKHNDFIGMIATLFMQQAHGEIAFKNDIIVAGTVESIKYIEKFYPG
jgi:hypothetical protein